MTKSTSSQASAMRCTFYYGYIVVAAAFLILVAIHGTRYSFGVFIKPMLSDFGWTRAMISAAFSISWVMEGVVSIFLGKVSDNIGPRIVMSLCGFVTGIGYLLMSRISDITQLYLIYGVLLGAGNSVFAPLVSTTARWFTRKRTVMTGIVTAGIGAGALGGPPIAERLIGIFDWRLSTVIIGIAILIVVMGAAQFLKRDPAQISQAALGDKYRDDERVKTMDESFSLREASTTGQFWAVFGMATCFGFSVLTVQVHLVPYVTDLGVSAATAANILAIVGGASIVGRVILGSLGDQIGNKQTFRVSFILMLLALVWFMFIREIWAFYLFATIFGMGYGGCAVQLSPLTAKLFGLTSLGLIFAVVTMGFTLGAAIGPFVAGHIFDISGSYQLAFLVCMALLLIGIILNTTIKPTRINIAGKL